MDSRYVLIADDVRMNRKILAKMLADRYLVLEAEDGEQTMELLHEHQGEIVAVLLDIVMPKMNGMQVLDEMQKEHMLNTTPVLIISVENSVEFERDGFEKGASDFIHKPFNATVVRKRLDRVVDLYDHKNRLEDLVDKQTRALTEQVKVLTKQEEQLREVNSKVVEIMSNVVEFRDLESGAHVKRVKAYSEVLSNCIMKHYPEYGLTKERCMTITAASAMHDIGKIAIPDSILLKPGRLTPEEFEIMKIHTVKGAEIVDQLAGIQDEDYHSISYNICRHHHEKFDGHGYPDGLVGDEIPIEAQIVAVADCYDALTSKRVYKPAFTPEKAYEMIQNNECGTFNKKLMDCMTECKDRFAEIHYMYEDAVEN